MSQAFDIQWWGVVDRGEVSISGMKAGVEDENYKRWKMPALWHIRLFLVTTKSRDLVSLSSVHSTQPYRDLGIPILPRNFKQRFCTCW